jgi:hypothetical protein
MKKTTKPKPKRKATPKTRQLSLRPYNGYLYVAYSRADYERQHKRLFKEPDVLHCNQAGRFAGGCGPTGFWTYLIWAESPSALAHELAHVVLAVFERCGINPCEAGGEPFCYMLSQLMLDAM